VNKSLYDEAYFEGRNSNYWWTVGSYKNLQKFPHWNEMLKVIKEIKANGKLLDIGCAYGFLINAASIHFESYGIDISKFAVKKSKELCRGKVSRASAVSLPFKNESFSVVTVVDTLEHVPNLNQCLKDIVRILKKDGVLFLQLPNPLVWTHLCGRLGLKDETHTNNFWLKQWKTVLAEHGLRVEKCFGMVAFASRKIQFFVRSSRAASLLPQWWIIARK
jgi:2-polyprenyl-3-methyl-5-hydroxy-6-metoxy-1,4-benzoquinol methylase